GAGRPRREPANPARSPRAVAGRAPLLEWQFRFQFRGLTPPQSGWYGACRIIRVYEWPGAERRVRHPLPPRGASQAEDEPMKSLALAVTVAAGLLCSASSADAQFRYRRGATVYSSPTYSYPTYSSGYSAYGYPTYSSPSYYDSGVVTSGYYTPSYAYPSGTVITSGGTYYTSPSY